jgi:hypothetical protein
MLLALFACSSAPQSNSHDIAAYVQAAEQKDLTEGLAACDRIEDPALKGECTAFQVQEHGRKRPNRSQSACEGLSDGLWRDECHFLLAEAVALPEKPEAAAAVCRASGRYFQPCFMHLLSAHAGHLRSTRPAEEVNGAYAQAVALAGEGAPADFAHRAWSLLFREEAERSGTLDPSACEALAEYGPACRSGVREALSRALQKAMREDDGTIRQRICASEGPSAEALAPILSKEFNIRIQPHPVLNAPLEQWWKRHCKGFH